MRQRSLKEVASAIHSHLIRMEADPLINTKKPEGLPRLWHSNCFQSGRYVGVTYISFQGPSFITRSEAEMYLAALNAGDTRRHFDVLRDERTREGR
jgi:hypothetical protein